MAASEAIPQVVREYLAVNGRSPYAAWFDRLNASAAAKATIAVTRIGQGNFSNVTPVGGGVSEYRIHFGPGYRIYFGKDGPRTVILLGGGSKKGQQDDIIAAQGYWQEYKRRKAQGKD
jgi:putative addiction module killer protein